jgi:hypothetical protein
MPRGDQTGPMGGGAMTGRGRGICAGYGVPGYTTGIAAGARAMGMGFRRGQGGGMGGGRRFCRSVPAGYGPNAGPYGEYYGRSAVYPSVIDPEIEKRALRSQADAMQRELDAIHQRLHAMESEVDPNQHEKG